jgi:hypothetical protein
MTVFRITNGPLLNYSPDSAGWFEATFAKEDECDQALAYCIKITNQTDAHLWIENIFFRLHDREDGLIPIFPNRSQSYPHKLPVSLQGGHFTVEYAVPFALIPPVVAKSIGIRVRYRSYFIPMPIYKNFDLSDDNFRLFLKALRFRDGNTGR